MHDSENSITGIIEAYKAAVYDKDLAAFMRLYDPQVRVFDAWGVWSYEGAASWQRAVEGWFKSLGSERVQVTFDEVAQSAAGEIAFMSAIVTYASVSAEGAQLRAMQNRLTWGIETGGAGMRIIHEHTSAPIGFDDQKAILCRVAGA